MSIIKLAPFLVSIVTFRRFPGIDIFSGGKLSWKSIFIHLLVKLKYLDQNYNQL
jgi:hypothetical protein